MIYTPMDTETMLDAYVHVPPPKTFLQDTFFNVELLFPTEFVTLDLVDRGKPVAAFSSPLVQGVPRRERGSRTLHHKAAYIKEKTSVDPEKALRRRPGESPSRPLSPAERVEMQKGDIMMDHRDSITRRIEQMVSTGLLTGKIIVKGKGIDAEIDFGRHNDLTIKLVGDKKWNAAKADPLGNLETWQALIAKKSSLTANYVIMDRLAWNLFRANESVIKLLDNRRGNEAELKLGASAFDGVDFKGDLNGFLIYVYDESYDADGAEVPMIPDNTVLMVSKGIEGIRAYGAIKDPRAGFQSLPFFPKNWMDEDPATEWVMTQSAPLPFPRAINGCAGVTVV